MPATHPHRHSTPTSRARLLCKAAALAIPLLLLASASSADHIARMESGLLGPVLVEGETPWTLRERMAHYRLPGVSIAVIEGFEVVWEKGYGVAQATAPQTVNERTLFQAASISKPVTASAVMRLVDQGRLDLSAEVNSKLRSWKLPENDFTRQRKVSFAHLLSHSGGTTVHGFPGYSLDDPLPTLNDILEGRSPANTAPIRVDKMPGEGFRYSGGGTTIVQQAIQDMTAQPFAQFMRETVLIPAGMARSTFEQPLPPDRWAEATYGHGADGKPVPGNRHVYPEQAAAGLWTTAGDLARFAAAIQRSSRGDRGELLSPESARLMLTRLTDQTGIGFFVDAPKPGYFGHGGGNEGFVCSLIAHKEKGYGAVVMTNGSRGGALAAEVLRGIAREYGWEGFLPERLTATPMDADQLRALSGRWKTGGDAVLNLTPGNARLVASTALEPAFELIPIGSGVFVRTDREVRYEFSGKGDGLQLVIEQGGKKITATRVSAKTRTPSELLVAGDREAARSAYQRARTAKPDDPTLTQERLSELGAGLLLSNRADEALALLTINSELYPSSAMAQHGLAEAHRARGEKAAAVAAFRKALALAESDPEVAPFRDWARYTIAKHIRVLSSGTAAPGEGKRNLAGEVDKLFASLDKTDSPGCALAVVKDGRIVYKRGYGMANLEYGIAISPSSVFYIASVSKQFTAASIAVLVKEGKLSLDDRLRRIIPELPALYDGITVRHLIHHTSGVRDYLDLMTIGGLLFDDVFSDENILDLLARQKQLNFKPGERYLYSNSGYALLGMIVKRVTGQSLRQFADHAIFKPLGMNNTQFRDDRTEIVRNRATSYVTRNDGGFSTVVTNFDRVGDGGLLSTVEDLYLWDQNLYRNQLAGGDDLIDLLLTTGTLNDGGAVKYAFGLVPGDYKGQKSVGHGGAFLGFTTDMIRFPEKKLSVICLCNVPTAWASTLTRKIADLYLGADLKEAAPAVDTFVSLSEQDLQNKAGTYRNRETGTIWKLSMKDGSLTSVAAGLIMPLAPLSPSRFVVQNAPARITVEFQREKDADPWTTRMFVEGQPPAALEPLAEVSLTAAQLQEYAGRYESDEVPAAWELKMAGDKLLLSVKKMPDRTLSPLTKDEFRSDAGTLKFLRDSRGRVTGLLASTQRARNIGFEKAGPKRP